MGALEYLIKIATDAAPDQPGSQTNLLYIVLNLTIPIILGLLLVWITKGIEKGLNLILGERR